MRLRAVILAAALALAPAAGPAQGDLSMGQVRSPVLTLDVERLLAETRFGRRLSEDIRARAEAVDLENEQLRIQLTEEERALAERRPTMEVEEFRAAAEAFDQRVQQIRAEQDAEEQALESSFEQGRQDFLNTVQPILGQLMVDRGAAVLLERRDVFLSALAVDITDEAILAIDEELGDGTAPSSDDAVDDAAGEGTGTAPPSDVPLAQDPEGAEPDR